MLEHQVNATPPGQDEPVFFASFSKSRWQWAEKLAKYLLDKGYSDVTIELGECEDDEVDEDDEE